MWRRYNVLPVQLSQLIVVFHSAAALECSAAPRHRLRCSVLPAFCIHHMQARCVSCRRLFVSLVTTHTAMPPYHGAKRSASILHVCQSTKNKPFLIVVCDSVSIAKIFTSQPCVNVLRQNRDSITLFSSPIFLFCAADSRTIQNKITEYRWLPGGLFPSAARAAQMLSLLFALWFLLFYFVKDAPQYPLWGLASAPIGPVSCPAPILHLALLRPCMSCEYGLPSRLGCFFSPTKVPRGLCS
jgi:hypothetical protein